MSIRAIVCFGLASVLAIGCTDLECDPEAMEVDGMCVCRAGFMPVGDRCESTTDTGMTDGGPDTGDTDAGTDAGTAAGPILDPFPAPPLGPLDIWYDAQAPTGVYGVVPAPFETWTDRAGSNHARCQNTRLAVDEFGTNRHAVILTGSDSDPSYCQFANPDLTNMVIVAVLATNDGRDAGGWIASPLIVGGDRDGTHNDGGFVMAGGRLGFTRRNVGHDVRGPNRYDDNMLRAYSMVRGIRFTVDGPEVEPEGITIFVNNFFETSGTTTAGRVDQPGEWYLGAHQTLLNGRFSARYAEVLIFDRTLNGDEILALNSHISCRHGI